MAPSAAAAAYRAWRRWRLLAKRHRGALGASQYVKASGNISGISSANARHHRNVVGAYCAAAYRVALGNKTRHQARHRES